MIIRLFGVDNSFGQLWKKYSSIHTFWNSISLKIISESERRDFTVLATNILSGVAGGEAQN